MQEAERVLRSIQEKQGNDLVIFAAADWEIIKNLINKTNPEIGKTINKAGITCAALTLTLED